MEPEPLQSSSLEPVRERCSPVTCEGVTVKEEPDKDDDASNESISRQIKLEPETVISEDTSCSFQFETVQKEELDIEDIDDLFEEDECSASSSDDQDSAEEGFESHADFVLHQRWRKQLIVKKSAREPAQTKQPVKKTPKEQFFSCHKCDATFTSWKEYRVHLRMHQMQHIIAQGIYKCERCDMAFASRAGLTRHTERGTAEKCPEERVKLSCGECKRTYYSRILYEKHVLRHQKAKNKVRIDKKAGAEDWECEECGKKFPVLDYFRKHQRMHDAIKNAKYRCDVCQKLFAEQRSLYRHVKSVHNKSQKKRDPNLPREAVDCPVCSKSVYKDGLKTHLRYHKYLTTERYKCDECSKVFSNKAGLAAHKLRRACAPPGSVVQLHDERKPYTCAECDKSFFKQTYLNTHIKRIHENKRQGVFQCGTCHNAFGSKSHLATHELTHAPREQREPTAKVEKPPEDPLNLVCSECGKGGFPTRKSVITHLKRVHENKSKGKYQCQTCNKIFGSRSNLQAHEQTHDPQQAEKRSTKKKHPPDDAAEQTNHVCTDCGKRLPNRKSLLTHTKRVHEHKRNGTFRCQTCSKVFGSRRNLVNHERSHAGKGREPSEEGDSDDLSEALLLSGV
uniref:Zinc finger protein 28 homolog n=1 Tax=Culex pipiens TaxID=7175 RepID=A0A8D8GU99_CULPI